MLTPLMAGVTYERLGGTIKNASVVTLELPSDLTKAALAAMKVTFAARSILATQITDASSPPVTKMIMPIPRTRQGRWNWTEKDDDWTEYRLVAGDASARLSADLPVIRRGLRQLEAGIRSEDSEQ